MEHRSGQRPPQIALFFFRKDSAGTKRLQHASEPNDEVVKETSNDALLMNLAALTGFLPLLVMLGAIRGLSASDPIWRRVSLSLGEHLRHSLGETQALAPQLLVALGGYEGALEPTRKPKSSDQGDGNIDSDPQARNAGAKKSHGPHPADACRRHRDKRGQKPQPQRRDNGDVQIPVAVPHSAMLAPLTSFG